MYPFWKACPPIQDKDCENYFQNKMSLNEATMALGFDKKFSHCLLFVYLASNDVCINPQKKNFQGVKTALGLKMKKLIAMCEMDAKFMEHVSQMDQIESSKIWVNDHLLGKLQEDCKPDKEYNVTRALAFKTLEQARRNPVNPAKESFDDGLISPVSKKQRILEGDVEQSDMDLSFGEDPKMENSPKTEPKQKPAASDFEQSSSARLQSPPHSAKKGRNSLSSPFKVLFCV
jgi:hypothetical protein